MTQSKPSFSERAVQLIAVVGETASGKSALALELAECLDGEIICADSWTVYGKFDIGTAKPTPEERARVAHHLLDVADPLEGFSAAGFKRLAQESIKDIIARGKTPILVGGTGLYIDSILYDYEFLPPPTAERRQELNALSLTELLEKAEILGLGTEAIDTRNKRRVIRLIENNGRLPTRKPLRPKTLIVGLRILREQLQSKIEQWVDVMLAAGLEQEAQKLADKYGWEVEPMKGIGYREWQGYFAGLQTLVETREQIIRNSLALAKKQRTWFKRNEDINWFDDPAKALEFVQSQV